MRLYNGKLFVYPDSPPGISPAGSQQPRDYGCAGGGGWHLVLPLRPTLPAATVFRQRYTRQYHGQRDTVIQVEGFTQQEDGQ